MTYRPLSLYSTEAEDEESQIKSFMQLNYEPYGENLKMDDYMLLKMRTQIMDNQECTT